jgi:flagellum-specific peptidoglycan hydrolase FlgJ
MEMGKKYTCYSYWRSTGNLWFKSISKKKKIKTNYNSRFLVFFIFLLISSCGVFKSNKVTKKNNFTSLNNSIVVKEKKEIINDKPYVKQVIKNNRKENSNRDKAVDYIEKYKSIAILEMKKYKIPASITIAQGLLESGMGLGRLAVKANNHFGIKCHKKWKGKKIYHDDDKKQECFRKYKNPSESYRDHSLFLVNRDRYSFLFNLKTKNYKGWAKGLKKAGYATDPKYPEKLISLIERFNLDKFDSNYKELNKQKNNKTYFVKKGDTLFSISKKYKISLEVLKIKNGLNDSVIFVGQELIIPN